MSLLQKILYARFITRNDTAANWATNNIILKDGESGYEKDTGKFKFGNGATAWNQLPYGIYALKCMTADKTAHSISFKNNLNNTISFNGSADIDLTGGVYYATTAYKVLKTLTLNVDGGTVDNVSKYTFDGSNAINLNITAGRNIKLTPTTNTVEIISSYLNYYTTALTWINGTTAGPTSTITVTKTSSGPDGNLTVGTNTVSVGAIPSASATTSGIVTTGAQTFAGIKTLNVPTQPLDNNTTLAASTAYVINAIASIGAIMVFKGTIGTNGTITSLPNDHKCGDTYRVVTRAIYAGQQCEVGDVIICINTGTTANDADWTISQRNEDGVVIGPQSAINNNIAIYDGITGKLVKDSGKYIKTSVPENAVFTDKYPTSFAWTNGTTSGPTGTLAGDGGLSSVIYPAIPTATNTTSGIITTGSQSVKGVKTFVDGIVGNVTGNSTSASKVNNSLILKVNTGTTEGTNLYTFDGSTSKSLDIKQGRSILFTSAANSCTIAINPKIITKIITRNDWNTTNYATTGYYTYTITDSSILSTSVITLNPNVTSMTNDQISDYNMAMIYMATLSDGSLELRAYGKLPMNQIVATIKIL